MKITPILLVILYSTLLTPQEFRNLLGDVNNDGNINIHDIVRTVYIALEIDPPPTDFEIWAADVNIDDQIDIYDIILIVDVVLGTIDCPIHTHLCSSNYSECCPDTTLNINWEYIEVGLYYSNFRNVDILNDSAIYVVGDFEMGDSDYGQLRWNGSEWIPEYLNYVHGHLRPRDIEVFGQNDIWYASGSIFYSDEDTITIEWLLSEESNSIFTLWAIDSQSIYFAGEYGSIKHFDGQEITDIYNPFDEIEFRKIVGNPVNGNIFFLGWENSGENTIVMMDSANNFTQIHFSDSYWPTETDWGYSYSMDLYDDTLYVVSPAGLVKYNYANDTTDIIGFDIIGNVQQPVDISVVHPSEIVMWGMNGEVSWFTGLEWNHYFSTENNNILINRGEVLGNTLIGVGYCCFSNHGVILKGYIE